jgi:nicotinamidase-related amidase
MIATDVPIFGAFFAATQSPVSLEPNRGTTSMKTDTIVRDNNEKSPVVLLLIDVINAFDFPDADKLLRFALPMADKLRQLRETCRGRGIAVVYVNDNFGHWRSDFRRQIDRCLDEGCKGRPIVSLLKPDEADYFVLKPAHSGFFSTALDVLLRFLNAETLIVTGIATNMCVQFTANDGYFRNYRICVPRDCVAANTAKANNTALEQMAETLKAIVVESSEIPWDELTKHDVNAIQ